MGGDPPAAPTNESTADMLQAYTQYFPGLMTATNSQLLPTAQAQLASDKAVSPGQNQLAFDLYKQFGPMFNQIGSQIENQQKLSSAQTDADVLSGPGAEIARQTQKIRQEADPAVYAAQQAIAKQAGNLANSIDMNGLSGSERAEVERKLNQDNQAGGRTDLTGGINTVNNAMQFGSALQGKQQRLGQALGSASGALAGADSKFDPVQAALGRSSTSAGDGKFGGPVQNSGSNANSMGGAFLGQVGAMKQQENQINSQRRDSLDRVAQGFGMVGSL